MPARMPASGPSRRPSRLAARWTSGGSGITATLRARSPRQGIVGHHHQIHDLRPQALHDMGHHRPAAQLAQRLRHARPHAPALAARQDDADQGAGPYRPQRRPEILLRLARHGLHYAGRKGPSKGRNSWRSASPRPPTGCTRSTGRAPSSVGGPTVRARGRAHRLQGAGRVAREARPRQGPLVGYKIALTSPQIWEQTGLRGPGLRADPQEARVRAQGLGARRPVGAARR